MKKESWIYCLLLQHQGVFTVIGGSLTSNTGRERRPQEEPPVRCSGQGSWWLLLFGSASCLFSRKCHKTQKDKCLFAEFYPVYLSRQNIWGHKIILTHYLNAFLWLPYTIYKYKAMFTYNCPCVESNFNSLWLDFTSLPTVICHISGFMWPCGYAQIKHVLPILGIHQSQSLLTIAVSIQIQCLKRMAFQCHFTCLCEHVHYIQVYCNVSNT